MSELMYKVVTVEEAQDMLQKYPLEREKEVINIGQAWSRNLAENIIAAENVPGFSRSTMDGYAVNSHDTFGASEGMPAYVSLKGEVKMGENVNQELQPGEALAIPTGGMLPSGADAVVIIEDTEMIDDNTVGILKPAAPGENIIRKGEDVQKGDILFKKNHSLRSQDLGVLAAVGITEIPVFKPLKVGIISTGNELVSPEKEIKEGQIRDINSYSLYGLVKEAGGQAVLYGIIEDNFEKLQSTVEKALEENDIVLLSGGSSVGTRDLTLQVIEELPDLEILFHGISIKPGKPAITAAGNGKYVFGLPGHPVSAMIAFNSLAASLISGDNTSEKFSIKAVLTRSLSSPPGREEYVKVKVKYKNNEIYAEPVLGKSALITTMVKSDGEIVIPLGKEGLEAGENVFVSINEGVNNSGE